MVVCFIGHRNIEETEELRKRLLNFILDLINNKGVDTFLFGSKSQFNDLCLQVVSEIKENKTHIKRVYVRAEYFYIDEFYKNFLLRFYDETYFPPQIENAGQSVYVERNKFMIDNSDYCIFYYNKNYMPQRRIKKVYCETRKSGTQIAFDYATSKNKNIINLF